MLPHAAGRSGAAHRRPLAGAARGARRRRPRPRSAQFVELIRAIRNARAEARVEPRRAWLPVRLAVRPELGRRSPARARRSSGSPGRDRSKVVRGSRASSDGAGRLARGGRGRPGGARPLGGGGRRRRRRDAERARLEKELAEAEGSSHVPGRDSPNDVHGASGRARRRGRPAYREAEPGRARGCQRRCASSSIDLDVGGGSRGRLPSTVATRKRTGPPRGLGWWQTRGGLPDLTAPLRRATNGDGIGDLAGILEHLDHLAGGPDSLGCRRDLAVAVLPVARTTTSATTSRTHVGVRSQVRLAHRLRSLVGGATARACGSSSTSCSTTAARSTPGSRPPARAAADLRRLVHLARPGRPSTLAAAARRTTGDPSSAGSAWTWDDARAASSTCTRSCPSSPT